MAVFSIKAKMDQAAYGINNIPAIGLILKKVIVVAKIRVTRRPSSTTAIPGA